MVRVLVVMRVPSSRVHVMRDGVMGLVTMVTMVIVRRSMVVLHVTMMYV